MMGYGQNLFLVIISQWNCYLCFKSQNVNRIKLEILNKNVFIENFVGTLVKNH